MDIRFSVDVNKPIKYTVTKTDIHFMSVQYLEAFFSIKNNDLEGIGVAELRVDNVSIVQPRDLDSNLGTDKTFLILLAFGLKWNL